MPSRPVSRLKRRPLAYARPRPRPRRRGARPLDAAPVRAASGSPEELAIFSTAPAELPVAVLRSRAPTIRIRAMLAQWRISSWTWLRPRAVPFVVAVLGLVAVLASQDYLRHVPVASLHHHLTSR
jgi:hypothetical protein